MEFIGFLPILYERLYKKRHEKELCKRATDRELTSFAPCKKTITMTVYKSHS